MWDLHDQTCLLTVRPKAHKIRGDLSGELVGQGDGGRLEMGSDRGVMINARNTFMLCFYVIMFFLPHDIHIHSQIFEGHLWSQCLILPIFSSSYTLQSDIQRFGCSNIRSSRLTTLENKVMLTIEQDPCQVRHAEYLKNSYFSSDPRHVR